MTTPKWGAGMAGALLLIGLGAQAAVPPPALGSAAPNATNGSRVQSVLQRLTLSLNPSLLARVRLRAEEVWTTSGAHPRRDAETDDVTFYRSVPVEIQTSLNGRALSASSLRHQREMAARLRHELDQQGGPNPGNLEAPRAERPPVAGHRSPPPSDPWERPSKKRRAARLLDLGGEIWTVGQFVALYHWSIRPGPPQSKSDRAGLPTLLLAFTPAPARHPHSRMGRILHHTAGTLTVDARTGQILAGSFHNLRSVRFGAGLLGDISHFDGVFTMQPVSVAGSSEIPSAAPASPAGDRGHAAFGAAADHASSACWVMRRIVIHVQGRKLFHRERGTETITYRVAAPVNRNHERNARFPRRDSQSASAPACAGSAAGC